MGSKRKPTFIKWHEELVAVRRLRTGEQCIRYSELVGMVTGNEASKWLKALIDNVVVAEDHGVYEGTYNAVWSFSPAVFGKTMVALLPGFLRRMNRYEQVERFMIGLESRKKHRTEFLRAYRKAPENERRRILRAFSKWSRGGDGEHWENLVVDMGGKPPQAARVNAGAPSEWPAKWRKFYEDAMADKKRPSAFWEWRSRTEAARFAAHMLSRPLGKKWRDAEIISNAVFVGYAGKYFSDFLGELKKLSTADRRVALDQLNRVGRARRTKAIERRSPKLASKIEEIERLRKHT